MRFAVPMVIAAACVPHLSAASVFRAGYAEVDITPREPLPMWGYGIRHDTPCAGTRDPLMANCIVLDAGEARLALVGLDLGRSLGEPHYSRIRERVGTAAGVEHVMLVGSHTHHGPVLELRAVDGEGLGKYDDAAAYVATLEQQIIDVITAAASSLQEARIGWGAVDLDKNRNRHSKRESQPRDAELAVIRLDDSSGRPIALLVNFAAHPVCLNPSDLRWSADYPGVLKRAVMDALGVPCVFLQGAAGDLSVQTSPADSLKDDDPARVPRDGAPGLQASLAAVKAAKNLDEAAASELAREFIQSDFRMEAFGRGLGKEAVAIAMTIQTSVPAQPLIHGSYERLAFASRIDFRNPQVVAAYAAAFFPELAQAYASDHRDNVIRPALTTVVINSQLALVGGSGEFFCSHANHLKEQSPGVKTLFFGYCNGHHMYFPTVEAAAEGGYGADAFVAWTEIGGGEQIVSRAVANIHRMLGEPDAPEKP